MTLGQKIRDVRKAKGWTQKELATRLGMTVAQISRWEQDHVTPRTRNLEDLAKVFEVPEDDFQNLRPAPASQLFDEDPELLEIVTQLNTLSGDQRKAVKLVIQSMVTCQRLQDLASISKASAG